jgi:hypothetical protein
MSPGPVQTLKVEGVLMGPWVSEVRASCGRQTVGSGELRLDLAAVTFADAEGARLLRDLVRQGAILVACSGFVAELLQLEEP